MKFLLIILVALSAAQRNSEEETWRLFQDHREALEDNDPGLIDKGKDQARHQDPDHELDKIKTIDNKDWLNDSVIAALVGGGISFLSVLLFILRLIQKIREIRRAGEGMGDLLLDLLIALLSFVRRRQNAPIDA